MVKNETIKKRSEETASLEESLLNAAERGNVKMVTKLIQKGIDVNVQDRIGWSPLHMSAFHGHEACVELLLKSPGIEVNAEDSGGWTPLHCAAEKGHIKCLELLLDAPGVEVSIADHQGQTPLHCAAFNGQEICARRLLQTTGVDINVRDIWGQTPLHFASGHGHVECVRLLLGSTGVNVNAEDKVKYTPIHLATMNNQTECVRLLLTVPEIIEYIKEHPKNNPRILIKRMEIDALYSKVIPDSTSSGGKPNAKTNITKDCVTYAGKKYMVRMGSKGGKYILVGSEKKKVYVK